ncbi:MAG: sulfite exporter TauE/SafE family protein [Acidobacteria bacterium]|nr:sulfite exporter TauE/SafE family protein [Acidobacteriota bacterium]
MEGLLIPDPMFYVLAVPVVLLVGIGKGGFGGGIGMVAVPALSFVVPLPLAAAVLLPILCVMDLFAVAAYRGKYSGVNLRRLIPSAIVGIGLGALAFGALDERWLRVIVGLIAITFSVQWLVGLARHRGRAPEPRSPGVGGGIVWGVATGFTSTLAHAGGPPASVYLLPQRLHPTIYVGTTVILFTFVNYVKLIPYSLLGQLRTESLVTSLVLLPLAPVGILLGKWLHERVDEVLFYRIAYGLLLITGLKLVSEGFTL